MKEQPTLTAAKLIDIPIGELNTALVAGLSWLDASYGRAEKLKEGKTDPKTIPAVYTGGKLSKDYINLLPDKKLGNYAFIDVNDPVKITGLPHQYPMLEFDCGIVFWFDYRTVYPNDHLNRSIENVKYEVFDILNNKTFTAMRVTLLEMYDQPENVYRGYSHNEIDVQFNKRPYGCFRINCNIKYRETC